MKTSPTGLTLVAEFEGFRAERYPDVGGRLSIGFGHLIKPGEQLFKITYDQGVALLAQDIVPAENAVNSLVRVALTQNQFDALVSLVFNIGSGNFMSSTLLKRLNGGDKAGAAAQFPVWVCVRKQAIEGLRSRRAAERKLFETV